MGRDVNSVMKDDSIMNDSQVDTEPIKHNLEAKYKIKKIKLSEEELKQENDD